MKKENAGFIVDGISFYTNEMAEIAAKELQGVDFISKKTDFDDIEMVFQVYHKLLEQDMFHTPVGLRFLMDIQKMLIENPFVQNEDIKPLNYEQILEIDKIKNESADLKKQQSGKSEVNGLAHNKHGGRFKEKFRISVIINIGLAITVIAMFVITLSSKNANIINYKNKLEDEYAQVQQQLDEREEQIRMKERELKINQ